ncbi:MAG: epoxyqueuosine reductase QueH [Phocaeicola sp.]|uniref:epoxyqueuosine reductase QueH n=1 Tax=Phocaeicola sp. TaxID=2773926 RepID=UPI003FA113E6
MKQKFKIEVPFGEKEVLLHTCCAPCSSAVIEWMRQNGVRPTIYFCNPNIYPEEEYIIRKDECIRYANSFGLKVVDADYNHAEWKDQMKGLEQEPERGSRCLKCFKFRLLSAAQYAHENGFKVLTTTLASSRWKSLEQVAEAGNYAVSFYPDVIFWAQNWRKGGLSDRRNVIIKDMNFYNQQYCGCEYNLAQVIAFRKNKMEKERGTSVNIEEIKELMQLHFNY